MNKSVKFVLNLSMLLCFLFTATVFGQDFDKLLEAVNKVENNLKSLVNKESSARATEIDHLKTKLENLKQIKGDFNDGSLLTDIREEIEKLHKKVESLSVKSVSMQLSEADIETVLNDIEFLKAENLYLRTLIEKNPKQLVSTDEKSFSQAFESPHNQTEDNSLKSSIDLGDIPPGLEITGFFDVVGSHQIASEDETEFGLGQAEVDLESELSEKAAISVAVAYNNESSNFELGAAELGINLFVNENSFINAIDVVAGQFDVPFGLDYQVYASIDRKLITEPWFADIHGGWRGWNDFGVQLQAASQYGNFVGYWVNGFEESAEVTQRIINLTTGLEEDTVLEYNTTPADAFGTRVGIIPIAGLEIGGSFAVGFNQSGKDEMTLSGVDIQLTSNKLLLKGEYLYHSVNRTIAKEGHQGYYFQPIYSFERVFITGRYSSFKPENEDWIDQVSLGAGYSIHEGVELRFETVINDNKDNNQNILQLVAGF